MMGTVHFSIEGEFVTNHARNLWAEGEYKKAKEVLDCIVGMPEEMKFNLIRGKLKLTGLNEVRPEPDNWQPIEYMFYPDPADMLQIAQDGYKAQKLKAQYGGMAISLCVRNLLNVSMRHADETLWADTLNMLRLFPDDTLEENGVMIDRGDKKAGWGKVRLLSEDGYWLPPHALKRHWERKAQEQAEKEFAKSDSVKAEKLTLADTVAIPSVDEYVKRQLELDTLPLPHPDDTCTSANGYITPDGNFYPCRWMEHRWLLSVLQEAGIVEDDSELVICALSQITQEENVDKPADYQPTDNQLLTLATWCIKHQYPLPDWAKPNESA